jgi:hypothetical protein
MTRSWKRGGLAVIAGAALGLASVPANACEPTHTLLQFGEPTGGGVIECQQGQQFCQVNGQGQPIPGTCVTCDVGGGQELCWASECRGFNGDTGQFGDFKKDAPGELEAIIYEIWNVQTNQTVTFVDTVANPDCDQQIPQQTAGITCSNLYKVKAVHPIGGSSPGPLCTFDNLDDVNTIARTPMSQGVIIVDVNGAQCEARKKVGDQWWMFYQTCCSPLTAFGSPGDTLTTSASLVFDQGNGQCLTNTIRPDQTEPETIPSEVTTPCL